MRLNKIEREMIIGHDADGVLYELRVEIIDDERIAIVCKDCGGVIALDVRPVGE